MKIHFLLLSIMIFLSACNPVKQDDVGGSVSAAIRSEAIPVVINVQRNIRASVYIVGDAAMVRVSGQPEQRLTGINPVLYPDYKSVLFRIHDLNRDGLSEIAVLASVSFGATDLCYDVFHYSLRTGKFDRRPENFYCTHG